MLLHKQTKALALYLVLAAAALFTACEYDVRELGPAPEASFTVEPISGKTNRYLLTSTSTNAFMYDWDRGDGKGFVRSKITDTAYFPDKGTYTVRLIAYGHGGFDTASQVINVAADDPAAQTPIKLLTGNSSKTWVLDQPAGGALFIGPNLNETWWSNTAADVTTRACQFNDEYTFSTDGTFKFDNKGDMWIDEESGKVWPNDVGLSIGCHQATEWPAQYNAWSSGTHQFQIINDKQLKVSGTGAHLGLYKVGENGITPTPNASITYDIVSISADKLVVKKDYGSSVWRFTFKAK